MTRRRWRGGRGGSGGACPRRIARFLEPCLLLLLRRGASHGYSLLDALKQFGFVEGVVDPSVVYRVLRDMESQDWVASEWDTSGSGAPRRVYAVTPKGEEYLAWWIADLRKTKEELERFLALYEQEGEDGGSA